VPGRTLHVVDVENLNGSALCVESEVGDTCVRYRAVAGYSAHDLATVACSHFAAEHGALYGWEGSVPQWRLRSGEHGADLELLEALKPEDVVGRFDRVVVGSGDGIFARPCGELMKVGIGVTVVARSAATLSGRMRSTVNDVRLLEHYGVGGSPDAPVCA
jgi:hypothetical protein